MKIKHREISALLFKKLSRVLFNFRVSITQNDFTCKHFRDLFSLTRKIEIN
jgi:hypothetical protein